MKFIWSIGFVVALCTLTALLTLTGCSKQQATGTARPISSGSSASVLTVKEYYDDDEARGTTIAHCSASTEAELNVNMKKPDCKNALAAQRLHDLGMKPE